jgi:class 3 adenylate cyclase
MSDFSIFSFIKAIVKINKDSAVLEYRKDARLLKGIPNYQVKMGFGLHIGWAIEGAIGSEYKIDASYLSPNVNMASRLEAATKQFGVHILISEDLYNMTTLSLRKFCRNIDRVTVKGSAKPLNIYTIDLKI